MPLVQDLSSHFSQLNRDRGEHYFSDGRVELIEVDADRIKAQVRCSREFEVEVDLSDFEDLTAKCGCPFARGTARCKHVWAVILAAEGPYTSLMGEDVAAPVDSGPGGDRAAFDPEQDLAYRVAHVQVRAGWNVVIDLYQGDTPVRLKRENLREIRDPFDRALFGRHFGLSDVPDEAGGIALPPIDVEAGTLRVECSSLSLNHEASLELVRALCATGRLEYVDRAGDCVSVTWDDGPAWELGIEIGPPLKGGEFEVRTFVQRGDERIPVPEIYALVQYGVLVQGGRAAAFDPRGNFDWVEKTLENGVARVPNEEQEALIVRLVEDGCEPRLVLPRPWKRTDRAESPGFMLQLRNYDTDVSRRDGIPCRLQFDYRGRPVAEQSLGSVLCDTNEHEVYPRDVEAEERARRELLDQQVEIMETPSGPYSYRLPTDRFHGVMNRLLEAGWHVESKQRTFRSEGALRVALRTAEEGFELSGELDFRGEIIPLNEALSAAQKGDHTVQLEDGTSGLIPEVWVNRLRMLNSMGKQRKDHIRFKHSQAWILDALLTGRDEVDIDHGFEVYRQRLESFRGIAPKEESEEFEGQLRDYQRDALGWFEFLEDFGLGGCLADDMGLGKTVQLLAQLDLLKAAGRSGRPSLVICPNSIVYNWIEEASRFTPSLRSLSYTGPQRAELIPDFPKSDLVVTTYGVLRRDIAKLKEVEFEYVVLDEAQAIKNASSQTAKCSRMLQGEHRLALTGTPIENRLLDLYSIFEFLNPGMFGNSSALRKVLSKKSKGPLGEEVGRFLAKALRPFLLRRTKEQVASELPEKTELTLYCEMEEKQRRLYQDLLSHYRSTLLQKVDEQGLAGTRMHVLEALLRLRQAACHPALIYKERAGEPSCKIDALIPLLQELIAEGHKALVFSQFTSYLSIVRRELDHEKVTYEYLDGQTRDRQARVDRFQTDPDCSIFLISLKAGGLGLNLTAADYVYILDPWWNPAVEAQAIDRAHRIGQTRQVFAYRLICRGTVEERILELQNQKRALADAIVRADNSLIAELTREDLERLLS